MPRIIRFILLSTCLAGFAGLVVGASGAQAAFLDYGCGDVPTDCSTAYNGGFDFNVVTVEPAGGGSVKYTESGTGASGGGAVLITSDGPEGCQVSGNVGICPRDTGIQVGGVFVSGNDDTVFLKPGATGLKRVFGGDGDDILHLDDGNVQTQIDCGSGAADVAFLDANDAAPIGCESVNPVESTPPPPVGSTPPPPVPSTPPDADGDGVPDTSDRCPSTAGPSSNFGCPLNAFSFPGKALVKPGLTLLRVRVPGPGVVKAAQSKVTKKTPALIKAVRLSTSKAGKVTLKLKPTKAGKKLLAKKGRFSVKTRVTYTPQGGKAKRTVARVKFIR